MEALRQVETHPSAAEIYDRAREKIPNISLGTVYRNLLNLQEDGEIQALFPGDGVERFDGNPMPHYHFYCRECACVSDVSIPISQELEKQAEEALDAQIDGYRLMLYGICKHCRDK